MEVKLIRKSGVRSRETSHSNNLDIIVSNSFWYYRKLYFNNAIFVQKDLLGKLA